MNINMVLIPVRSGSLRGFSGVLRFSENLNRSDGYQPGMCPTRHQHLLQYREKIMKPDTVSSAFSLSIINTFHQRCWKGDDELMMVINSDNRIDVSKHYMYANINRAVPTTSDEPNKRSL